MSVGVVESPWQQRRAYILHIRIQRIRFGPEPDQRCLPWTSRLLDFHLINTVVDLCHLVRLRICGSVTKSIIRHVDHNASSGISSNPGLNINLGYAA